MGPRSSLLHLPLTSRLQLPLPAGDTGDSAVPNVLALPGQASIDLARESWKMQDVPKVKRQESGKESPGDQEVLWEENDMGFPPPTPGVLPSAEPS